MAVKQPEPKRTTILLDRRPRRAAVFTKLRPRVVASVTALSDSVDRASKDSVWISYASDLTEALVKRAASIPSTLGCGLFLHPVDMKSLPVLSSLFRRIAFNVGGGFIPSHELAEVLDSEKRANLFIGGFVNSATETITFWRGNLKSLTVPWQVFQRSGDGTAPDFDDFSVIDCGQTVQLGDYEAAVDAILYEHDPEYRRAVSQRRRQEDCSFGAALRRLRKQRGLRQNDFEPDIAAKTVARIEQGKVTRIQQATLEALARRLAVEPQEIESF